MTDSFLTLGLGRNLVGVTDYCPQPDNGPAIRTVGGPKDARIAEILALNPDLVMLNREENSKQIATELEEAGIPLWITFPKSVADSLGDLRELAHQYASDDILQRVVWLERAVAWLSASNRGQGKSFFCPIWKDDSSDSTAHWTTFGGDTFANDLLTLCGGRNIFAERIDPRYPRVNLDEIRAQKPEILLVPSEPFSFSEEDTQVLLETVTGQSRNRTESDVRVDGRLLFWHGTRIGEAIRVLPDYFIPNAGLI